MSSVICSEIRDLSDPSVILVPNRGSIISTAYVRYDAKDTFVGGNYSVINNTNRIPGLRLTINASHPNNIIIAQWQISVESAHDLTFSVLRNLSVIDNSLGISRSNAPPTNNYYKGMAAVNYDNDFNSTLSNVMLQWIGRSGIVGNVDLDVCFHYSLSTGTIYLNRTAGSAGADGYETCVSTGVAFELTSQGGES